MVVTSKKAIMKLQRDALWLLLLRQLFLQLADAVLKPVNHGLNLPLGEPLLDVLGAVNVQASTVKTIARSTLAE